MCNEQSSVVGGLEDGDEQGGKGAGPGDPAQGEVTVGHAGPPEDELLRVRLVEAGAGDDGAVEEEGLPAKRPHKRPARRPRPSLGSRDFSGIFSSVRGTCEGFFAA